MSSTRRGFARRSGRNDAAGDRPVHGICLSRTVNLLPRPSPSLDATIVPPCSSTRRRTSGRPMPRPPLALVDRPIGLHVQVKDEGQQPRRDAEPRVFDGEHGVALVDAERHPNPAARRCVFDRVGHDVGQHLLQPHRVPIDPHWLGADVDVPIQLGVAGEGGDRPAYRLGHVERLSIQPDLSGRHALDVEQIVDQTVRCGRFAARSPRARAARVPPRRASTRARGPHC